MVFFLYHLKAAGIGDYISFIISDRDKGLMNAVAKLFPLIPHSKCLRHLGENFRKKFGEDGSKLLKLMATANTMTIYEFYRRKLYDTKGPSAIEWVENAHPSMWCRALFPVPRYGVITSNTVEIVFSTLRDIKHLPFLQLLMFMERYVLEKRFSNYKMYKAMVDKDLATVPKATEYLETETKHSTNLRCIPTGHCTATIEEYTPAEIQHYSISIDKRECTCNVTNFPSGTGASSGFISSISP
jgi:Transposase, Mutator family